MGFYYGDTLSLLNPKGKQRRGAHNKNPIFKMVASNRTLSY